MLSMDGNAKRSSINWRALSGHKNQTLIDRLNGEVSVSFDFFFHHLVYLLLSLISFVPFRFDSGLFFTSLFWSNGKRNVLPLTQMYIVECCWFCTESQINLSHKSVYSASILPQNGNQSTVSMHAAVSLSVCVCVYECQFILITWLWPISEEIDKQI